MKFYRIYIELTNICGLRCSFCPTKELPNTTMDLEFFERVIKEAKEFTNEIACHVMGDPLRVPNLREYLDILNKYNMKALLTTSGYFIKKHSTDTLFYPSVKQINISLNSFNKNDTSISFEQYIEPILNLCKEKVKQKKEIFINLRIWNLDSQMSERDFNQKVFDKISSFFNIELDLNRLNPKASIRLDYKVLLHFDNYFEWPSMQNPIYGHGTCQGLKSHIAILANGIVVPCCLDSRGDINLGNLHQNTLKEILATKKTINIIEGFKKGICTQELCLRCSYKNRFNKESN